MKDDPPPKLNYASPRSSPTPRPLVPIEMGAMLCLGAIVGVGGVFLSGLLAFGWLKVPLESFGPRDPQLLRHTKIAGIAYLAAILVAVGFLVALVRRKARWSVGRLFLLGMLVGAGAAMLMEGLCFIDIK